MSNKQSVPEGIQRILADNNQNGLPDIVEQALQNQGVPTGTNVSTNVSTSYIVRGKQYNSIEEMPAEDRAYMEQKLSKIKLPQTNLTTTISQSRGTTPGPRSGSNNILVADTQRNKIAVGLMALMLLLAGLGWLVYRFFWI